jgi:hypothetical protein
MSRVRFTVLATSWLVVAGLARAEILLPSSTFTNHGVLEASWGGTFDTSAAGGPTLTMQGGPTYVGNIYTYSNGLQVAVFQFDSISLRDWGLFGTGDLPVALLSYGDVTFETGSFVDFRGGPGSFAGGDEGSNGEGPGGGGASGFGGGGGGFGGKGGDGYSALGGSAYGDLNTALQGGSGGGGGGFGRHASAGGGGIQIGTLGTLTIDGYINANGVGAPDFAGAGSGGGILLYADQLNLNGYLSADGGRAPIFGGGGGGGRILIDTLAGGFSGSLGSVTARGGEGWYPSQDGVVTIQTHGAPSAVPEPSTLLGLFTGLAGLGLYRRFGRGTA